MTLLRQRMIAELRIRNYSPRTIDCYTRCIAAFARHFGQSPADLGADHIRRYQTHLIEHKRTSWSAFVQVVCALRFLYGTTLRRPGIVEDIPFPRQPKRLPVVLSPVELARFFAAIPNLKHRTVLMTMYAAGLRVLEALHLRVADVDSARQCLRVEQGKGQKDRYTLLPPTLLERLRTYWKAARLASAWLFPGPPRGQPARRDGRPAPVRAGRAAGRDRQAGHDPHDAPLLRHAPPGGGHRSQDHLAVARAPQPPDHGGLPPRSHAAAGAVAHHRSPRGHGSR